MIKKTHFQATKRPNLYVLRVFGVAFPLTQFSTFRKVALQCKKKKKKKSQTSREYMYCVLTSRPRPVVLPPGWLLPALCWWIQGCRFLAAEVWSWASAWKHQPSAPAAVWAPCSPWLHHQKHRHVVCPLSTNTAPLVWSGFFDWSLFLFILL